MIRFPSCILDFGTFHRRFLILSASF